MLERFRGHFLAVRDPKNDVIVLGIAITSLLLFVAAAGTIFPQIIKAWHGGATKPDLVLANALLLNIALILLGWSRYKALMLELAERCASEEEAKRQANTDPLTGCLNRRSFIPATSALLEQARDSARVLALFQIDLDNFKQINDLHGHKLGDTVLLTASQRLADELPRDAVLARLGGDEFACVITYGRHEQLRIDQLAERLVEVVSQPIEILGGAIEMTLSMGIASSARLELSDDPAIACDELMHKADIAMYQAKKQGKNRLFWFEPSMEFELKFRGELEAGIRRGLKNGEFIPYYEQQIDLDTGELVGFEMLARWQSPELGLVGPDIFIPISEEIGAIEELSRKLMIQALEHAKMWHPRITLSVNVSPIQLRDPWFAQKLLKLLVEHNFPASRLEIEITESSLHENIGMVRSTITSLRNQGIRVSLDDFGTGYSSLAQLRSLPFDRLKIDRSFVRELKHSGAGGKLVSAIISMGADLELPVTAEGIENDFILASLRKLGRLKGQGYHYGRPEPAEQVTKRLADLNMLADHRDDQDDADFGPGKVTDSSQKAG
ncbi:EAL domain-containing protein [Porphyrobacter algicida]|uniref:EAL domain-containing protein n=1 Tax=Qipengyuania algicida TaxID=1836209 RepID=A0A845ADJ2_9SPHN|nr:EAL domain-containing protein [Qipengyuania algicida]